jgi:hypothetical protein
MDYHFVFASNGNVPPGAQPNGHEADGRTQLWVARTIGNVSSLPGAQLGKVRPGLGGALFPFAGREVPDAYEVLMEAGLWIDSDGTGRVPIGAVVCGVEADGTPLFVARANFNGGLPPGTARAGMDGALIGWGGTEHLVTPYQMLVADTNAQHAP